MRRKETRKEVEERGRVEADRKEFAMGARAISTSEIEAHRRPERGSSSCCQTPLK